MSSLCVEVCKIEKVEKHPNADRLSIAVVKGWNCIIGLDQYKQGELVTFIPPDCVLPNELIEKYELSYLKNGGRTGTVKLRGCISQGLILPIPNGNFKVGDDVAKVLNIKKYEVTEAKFQQVQGKPTKKKANLLFDKYTDIENIKNYNSIFKDGDKVYISEKIHGTNSRFANLPISKGFTFIDKIKYYINKLKGKDYDFIYGSHNVQLNAVTGNKNFYGTDIYGQIAKRYNMKDIIPKDYIVYGEIYGEGIQDLTYGLKGTDLVIFDVKYKGNYLPYEEFKKFCDERNLPTVPFLYVGEWSNDLISKFTDGKSIIYPLQIREGRVIKSYNEDNNVRIGRKVLKSVSINYLTRKNGTEFK